jgi:hypothetical protein
VLPGGDPASVITAILQDLLDREERLGVAGRATAWRATIACHSSVRRASRCPRPTMAALVRDLPGTRHPTLCPHGRPDGGAACARTTGRAGSDARAGGGGEGTHERAPKKRERRLALRSTCLGRTLQVTAPHHALVAATAYFGTRDTVACCAPCWRASWSSCPAGWS